MKRRNVLLGVSAGLAAPALIGLRPVRAAANLDPNRLKSELTPLGAERAASASGHIPAWTGGATTVPAGWTSGMNAPNLFAGQAPSFTVTQANVAQYASMLPPGQIQMLNRYGSKGYKIIVYPTGRTAAAPQFVYDNTALNVTRIRPAEAGIIWGVQGGYCGTPWPILSDDPSVAGPQAIWNHFLRWSGIYINGQAVILVAGNGNAPIIASIDKGNTWQLYYDPSLTLEEYERSPAYQRGYLAVTAPPNEVGQVDISNYSSQLDRLPTQVFEYLVGEGRIRQGPDVNYDVPVALEDDIVTADETHLFAGKMDHYNWTLVGKKEMIVPYNNSDIFNSPMAQVVGPDTFNQDLMRYEIHRVWIVDAMLAPGKRHSMPRRRFYLDEDTWIILMSDGYDSQGNYWKFGQTTVQAHPELPGTIDNVAAYVIHNLQSNLYLVNSSFYDDPLPIGGVPLTFNPVPHSRFDAQSIANNGGL